MPSPDAARRIGLEDLAALAGVATTENAYQLLRLGRSSGRPETSHCDPDRVAVVRVLGRLQHLLPELCPPPDEVLLAVAKVLHAAASNGSLGMPRTIVAPVVDRPGRVPPPPALTTHANVGALMAGRAGLVVDLGEVVTDWGRPKA